MTVHKSQGSQFDAAAVVLPDPSSQILTRELLYTAVTRARERLILAGQRGGDQGRGRPAGRPRLRAGLAALGRTRGLAALRARPHRPAGNQPGVGGRLTRHGPVEGRARAGRVRRSLRGHQRGHHAHQGARRRHRRSPSSLDPPSPNVWAAERCADRQGPRLRDRRRRGARRAVRPASPRVRGLHGLGALAVVHRGLHPRSGAPPLREHPHRGVGDGVAHDRHARGRAAHHPRGRQRRRGRRRRVLRRGRDGRDRQARPRPRSRGRGRLRRSVRAPLQRAPVARVGRRRRDDRRGRRGTRRPRAPGARARRHEHRSLKIGSLLRGVERHGHHHRRRSGCDRAAPPRRAVAVGLRQRGAVSADRHEPVAGDPRRPAGLQGRGVHLAAQVRRRPGDAGRARGQARALREPRADGPQRRHDPLRQPDPALLPPRPRDPRGGRHAGDRRVDPRRARLRAQGSGRRPGDPKPRGGLRPPSAGVVRGQPADRDPRQPRPRATGHRLAGPQAPARPPALELRRGGAQRPVRHPGAQRLLLRGPVIHRMYPIDDEWSERMDAEVRGPPGRQARLRPPQLQLLHERDRLRLHPRGRAPRRQRGLEAAAALQLRSATRAFGDTRDAHARTPLSLHDALAPAAVTRPRPRACFPATWSGRGRSLRASRRIRRAPRRCPR